MRYISFVRIVMALVVALLLLVVIASPVYADTPLPSSTPQVIKTNVYRNLIEEGDRLFLIYANIPYDAFPEDPVTETFIWRLFDTDGVTELGSTVGYNFLYSNNGTGYGYNVYSMYFDNADNITWELQYPLRLSGNPNKFDTPPNYNYTISVADYSLLSDKEDEQAELASIVLWLANDLDNKWSMPATYSLISQIEAAAVLSIYGEAFFRGAIFGIQAMAPTIFSFVIRDIEYEEREWDLEYSGSLESQYEGTWIDTAREAGKSLFNTDFDLLSIIILLGTGVGVVVGNIILTGDHWNALVDAAVVLILGGSVGMYGFGFLGLVAAISLIIVAFTIWRPW